MGFPLDLQEQLPLKLLNILNALKKWVKSKLLHIFLVQVVLIWDLNKPLVI